MREIQILEVAWPSSLSLTALEVDLVRSQKLQGLERVISLTLEGVKFSETRLDFSLALAFFSIQKSRAE